VVEGHISKLRKKLRLRLGADVIDAKRYLGYQFVGDRAEPAAPATKLEFAHSKLDDFAMMLAPPFGRALAKTSVG